MMFLCAWATCLKVVMKDWLWLLFLVEPWVYFVFSPDAWLLSRHKIDALCWLLYSNVIELCNVFSSCLGRQPRTFCLNRCDVALSDVRRLRFPNYKLFSFIAIPDFQSLTTFTSWSEEQGRTEQPAREGKDMRKGGGRVIRMLSILGQSCQSINLINDKF